MRSMSSVRFVLPLILTACGGGAAVAEESTTPVTVTASPQALVIGGSVSNFGETHLSTGFLPDPHQVALVSGASVESFVNIDEAGITPNNSGTCTGFATSAPDYIVHLDSPGALLRFFVNAPGDTTLVINDGAGNWWCSDDDGGNLNPLIEIASPPAGQYDVWVGSYEPGANIQAVLSVTELDTNHP